MTESEKVLVDELPLAIVRRVVKDKLSECSPEYDVSIHKEAVLAFSESARIFIHYLSATANDNCKDSRRQTMKAEDVFKAIEDMGFDEFSEPLKASLEGHFFSCFWETCLDFKKKNAGKKAGGGGGAASSKPTETRKRKQEGASTQKGVRKSKSDEVDKKNDENDNTEENVNDEDDGTEENGNGEEHEKEEEDEEGNEENMEEEAGSGSGEHDEKESGEEEEAGE
ncbi:hypothetical protein Bca4012_018534 [Brassica carinata]